VAASDLDPGFGWWVVLSLCFGSGALWVAVWLPAHVLGSCITPIPYCVQRFWVLSRRERCLDNTQKSLRAAWIGVMQKDWITKGDNMQRVVACPWEAVTQPVGSPLQFVQRVRCAAAA